MQVGGMGGAFRPGVTCDTFDVERVVRYRLEKP